MTSPADTFIPDAETIKAERIPAIFKVPPGVSFPVARNALLIGSDGSGKTIFLRYAEAMHDGIAIRLDLASALAPIPKKSPVGPLTRLETTGEVASLIAGKAGALVALSLTLRMLQLGIEVSAGALSDCLPDGDRIAAVDEDAIRRMRLRIGRSPPSSFEGVAEFPALRDLVESIAASAAPTAGPLMLLFDRADSVSPLALPAVLQLLDQSGQFLTIVAARPGFVHEPLTPADIGISSDHFDVHHLGIAPRSPTWRDFLFSAIAAQLGDVPSRLAPELQEFVFLLSRHSIREAGRLAERGKLPPREQEAAVLSSADTTHELRANAAITNMRPYHPSFGDFLRRLILQTGALNTVISLPILIEPDYGPEELFPTLDVVDVINAGLREGAFCLPDGYTWTPGLRPPRVELPPLLVWSKSRPIDMEYDSERPAITVSHEALFARSGGGPRPKPSFFVAYPFDIAASIRFKETLVDYVNQDFRLQGFELRDGNVDGGLNWPREIEERLKRSKVVVADITALRPAVLFEVGYAWGLGIPVIGAVASTERVGQMPFWLSDLQVCNYEDDAGYTSIVEAIALAVREASLESSVPRAPRWPPAERPDPGVATWIRFPTDDAAFANADYLLQQNGLLPFATVKLSTTDDSQSILTALRCVHAALLVAGLNGTATDAFIHFVAGATLAKPNASARGKPLPRRVFIVEPSAESSIVARAAQNARRSQPSIEVCRPDVIAHEVQEFVKRYQAWARPK